MVSGDESGPWRGSDVGDAIRHRGFRRLVSHMTFSLSLHHQRLAFYRSFASDQVGVAVQTKRIRRSKK
jgi:hypothetical protein